MTAQNRADLVAFLESLTDESILHDRRFGDPWFKSPIFEQRAQPAAP